jgi:nitrogen fixation-related uncharacterized protein
MAAVIIVLFVVLVGPAALLWGVDSRVDETEHRRPGA